MNLFSELHHQLIKRLLEAGVEFIIIGGYSVIFHGYKRTTGDIDIWLNATNENKQKLLPVLKKLGLDEQEIAEIDALDFEAHIVLSLGEEPEKIDFLTHIGMVSFEDASRQKTEANFDGLLIPFLHLNHLVLSKMNTGRQKDKADVEMLQKIAQAKNKK